MKFFFFLISVLFAVQLVTAVGFSPSSLAYELTTKQIVCKTVTLNEVNGQISVSHTWAESEQDEWKLSNFKTSAEEHGLNLDYEIIEIENGKKIDVCISGENLGGHKGAIIFRQEQQGNSIIQFGVWLRVDITSPQETSPSNENSDSSSGGSSGSGTSGSSSNNGNNVLENEFEQLDVENLNERDARITGDAINDGGSRFRRFFAIIPIAIILGFVVARFYVGKRRKEFD